MPPGVDTHLHESDFKKAGVCQYSLGLKTGSQVISLNFMQHKSFNPLTAGFSDVLYNRLDKLSYLANYTLYHLETIH